MKTRLKERILLAVAAVVMLGAFTQPLWSIHLTAPQYRDGLGMHIHINSVTGHDTHDIQNINILNHYIGMKPIEPEAIPELEWMPKILTGLVIAGLVVALIGNRWLMLAWFVSFLGLGAVGLWDFYLWNLDYGHNLSPDAPIKVPGMTYSPPLIGQKVILNITARSYPHLGTLYLTIAAFLAGWALFRSFRSSTREDGSPDTSTGDASGRDRGTPPMTGQEEARAHATLALPFFLALLVAVSLIGCGGSPDGSSTAVPGPGGEPVDLTVERMVYGEADDAFCGGPVDRVRWGGELRTVDGERHLFRSVECMAAFVAAARVPADRVATLRVVDFPDGWRLMDVKDATFLRSPNLPSPDKLNLHAIRTERMVRNLHDAYTGELLRWDEVVSWVGERWGVTPSGVGS